jgi:effector-binding domain-containing protein
MMEMCKENKIKGWIVNIDFEKAFDTIEWPFLYRTMEHLGYPKKFIEWVKTLYQDIETRIINNGHTTEPFSPERGVRQGCPISPYLFILTTEIMNRWLKKKLSQYGIQDKLGNNYLISQFADDTSFALKENKEGIHKLFKQLKEFGEVSGLKLNISKTEILLLKHTSQEGLPKRYRKNIKEETHYLGCDISIDYTKTTKKNISNAVSKILNLTQKWINRKTTLSGKIAIIKSLLIPQLTYTLTTMASPDEKLIKEINKELFTFLNSGGSEKIKRTTLIGEYEEGGYKMTDLESYIKAIKLNWITRLTEIGGVWKEYIIDKITRVCGMK